MYILFRYTVKDYKDSAKIYKKKVIQKNFQKNIENSHFSMILIGFASILWQENKCFCGKYSQTSSKCKSRRIDYSRGVSVVMPYYLQPVTHDSNTEKIN